MLRFVNTADGGLIWPEESITGGASNDHTLLDTGWEIHWPGAGHVYLKDADIVDIIVPSLAREAVAEALVRNGWTSPGETNAEVVRVEAALAEAQQQLEDAKQAEVGFKKALEQLEAAHKKSTVHKKPAAAAAKTTKE